MGLSMLGADSRQWLLSEVVLVLLGGLVLLLSRFGEVCWLLGVVIIGDVVVSSLVSLSWCYSALLDSRGLLQFPVLSAICVAVFLR